MNKYKIEISKRGDKGWYLNGELHREDGPSYVTFDGYKTSWFLYGEPHRVDGPAIVWIDGDKTWCINGIYLTKGQHESRVRIMSSLSTLASVSN